jgi:hypothetical protein
MAVETTDTTEKQADPNLVLLGPRAYNRFLGNPPSGMRAEEAFQAEMGYPWQVELNAAPLLAKVDALEVQKKELQAEVDKVKATSANSHAVPPQNQANPAPPVKKHA